MRWVSCADVVRAGWRWLVLWGIGVGGFVDARVPGEGVGKVVVDIVGAFWRVGSWLGRLVSIWPPGWGGWFLSGPLFMTLFSTS